MIFDRIISFLLKYRVGITIFVALLTIVMSIQVLLSLKVDNSLSVWFRNDNPDYQDYLAFQKEQGSDEVIIAMLPTDDALGDQHFLKLHALHQKLDSLPFIQSTFSIAKAKYPVYSRRRIVFRNIIELDRSRNGREALLNQLPAIKNQLMTEDGRYSFFYVQFIPTDQIEADRKAVVNQIVTSISSSIGHAYISGPPILNEAYNDTIYEESIFFAIISVAVILVLLFFLLPNLAYLPLALLAVIVPVSISLGFMTGLGYSLNLISMLIPSVLMVYSISDIIHIINIYHQHCQDHPHQKRKQQIVSSLQKSLKPCFYTTITTIVGYLALHLSPLPAFKVMGLFTFLGLAIAFLMVYIITTIGFSYLPNKPLGNEIKKINISALVSRINTWTSYRQSVLMVIGGLIFVSGIVSIFLIEVNTDSLNLLGNGKAKEDLHFIQDKLGGSARLQLNILSKEGNSLMNEKILAKLDSFQNRLTENNLLAHSVSIANFRNFLSKRTPMSSLGMVSMEDVIKNSQTDSTLFFSLFSKDFSQLHINIHIKELETKDIEKLLADIKHDFQQIFPAEIYELKINGFTALYAQLNQFILLTQFRSFGGAFLLAFCILFYFIGNLKQSILALIPNILPLLLAAILMTILGIHLEAATAMLAPIMLGIAMDDTIHLMNKFKLNQEAGLSVTESMDQALSYTGGALFSTSISLVCGFLVVGLSGVVSVSIFGLLCAFTIVAALIADVIILPTLMKRYA